MKPQTSFLKVKLFALFVMLTGLSASAGAQTTMAVSVNSKPSLSVNYLGAQGNNVLFELTLQQPEETKSSLRIRDENGVQLYSELVTKKAVIKRVQIPKDELNKVEFVFSTGKDEVRKSYEIRLAYKEVLEVKDVTSL